MWNKSDTFGDPNPPVLSTPVLYKTPHNLPNPRLLAPGTCTTYRYDQRRLNATLPIRRKHINANHDDDVISAERVKKPLCHIHMIHTTHYAYRTGLYVYLVRSTLVWWYDTIEPPIEFVWTWHMAHGVCGVCVCMSYTVCMYAAFADVPTS